MTAWLLNNVPWYVWAALGVVPLIVFWPYIPSKLRIVLIGVGTLGLAYIAGRKGGSEYEREKQRKRDAAARENREKIEHDVAARDDRSIKRGIDKWMRDK